MDEVEHTHRRNTHNRRAVWKYAAPEPGSALVHQMPMGAQFVHVGLQEHEPFPVQAWFLVDPDAEMEERCLALVATGQPFGAAARYLGTVIHDRSRTVWHLIEPARKQPLLDSGDDR